jgi:hypothetical protein
MLNLIKRTPHRSNSLIYAYEPNIGAWIGSESTTSSVNPAGCITTLKTWDWTCISGNQDPCIPGSKESGSSKNVIC